MSRAFLLAFALAATAAWFIWPTNAVPAGPGAIETVARSSQAR